MRMWPSLETRGCGRGLCAFMGKQNHESSRFGVGLGPGGGDLSTVPVFGTPVSSTSGLGLEHGVQIQNIGTGLSPLPFLGVPLKLVVPGLAAQGPPTMRSCRIASILALSMFHYLTIILGARLQISKYR
jgi:hypothetical protein